MSSSSRPISLWDLADLGPRRKWAGARRESEGLAPRSKLVPIVIVVASVAVAGSVGTLAFTLESHGHGGPPHNQNNPSHQHHPKVLTPVALVALATQTAHVNKAGVASVDVSCTKADCKGSVTLTDGTSRVGFASIHLSPKGDATVEVTLNSHGRALMKNSAKDRLATHASFTLGSHTPVSSYLLLQGPPKPIVPPPTTTLPQRSTSTTSTTTLPRRSTTTTSTTSTTTLPHSPPTLFLNYPTTFTQGDRTINEVRATLSSGGTPLSGKVITFTANHGCTPGSANRVTNGSGQAEMTFSCPMSGPQPVFTARGDGASASV